MYSAVDSLRSRRGGAPSDGYDGHWWHAGGQRRRRLLYSRDVLSRRANFRRSATESFTTRTRRRSAESGGLIMKATAFLRIIAALTLQSACLSGPKYKPPSLHVPNASP